jgi:hypothetical protein
MCGGGLRRRGQRNQVTLAPEDSTRVARADSATNRRFVIVHLHRVGRSGAVVAASGRRRDLRSARWSFGSYGSCGAPRWPRRSCVGESLRHPWVACGSRRTSGPLRTPRGRPGSPRILDRPVCTDRPSPRTSSAHRSLCGSQSTVWCVLPPSGISVTTPRCSPPVVGDERSVTVRTAPAAVHTLVPGVVRDPAVRPGARPVAARPPARTPAAGRTARPHPREAPRRDRCETTVTPAEERRTAVVGFARPRPMVGGSGRDGTWKSRPGVARRWDRT